MRVDDGGSGRDDDPFRGKTAARCIRRSLALCAQIYKLVPARLTWPFDSIGERMQWWRRLR